MLHSTHTHTHTHTHRKLPGKGTYRLGAAGLQPIFAWELGENEMQVPRCVLLQKAEWAGCRYDELGSGGKLLVRAVVDVLMLVLLLVYIGSQASGR